jgi:hypothetical protein
MNRHPDRLMGDNIMKRTTDEVITEITKFLTGVGGAHDWDDCISIRIKDKRLDAVRIECSDLPDNYPPEKKSHYCNDEGLKRLEEILHDLKTEAAGCPTSRRDVG